MSSISADHRALLSSVDQLAETVLWPAAAAIDAAGTIPPTHFEALADLGLYGMVVPTDKGGLGLPGPVVRSVLRTLGGGCGATAFAFAQHHGTTATVASTGNQTLRQRWLGRLTDRTLVGIAYAHLRRSGPPVLTAAEVDGGWELTGTAPWVTSWGTAAAFGVAAATADDRIVWALVPASAASATSEGGVGGDGAGARGSMRVGNVFDLMVFGATSTVPIEFDRYRVEPELLLNVVDAERWAERDRLLAARPNPLSLGVGDRALALLGEAAPDAAAQMTPGWSAVAERAEMQSRLVDEGDADLGRVAATRAETLLAIQQLTTALLAAVGGRAMERGHPAQRLAREAQFYVVQAQNDDGRQAMLAAVAEAGRRVGLPGNPAPAGPLQD